MFREPVRKTPATDGKGKVIGNRFFYEAMDDDHLAEIIRIIPDAVFKQRGDLVEVFVPIPREIKFHASLLK
jgi:hypothetical protein